MEKYITKIFFNNIVIKIKNICYEIFSLYGFIYIYNTLNNISLYLQNYVTINNPD